MEKNDKSLGQEISEEFKKQTIGRKNLTGRELAIAFIVFVLTLLLIAIIEITLNLSFNKFLNPYFEPKSEITMVEDPIVVFHGYVNISNDAQRMFLLNSKIYGQYLMFVEYVFIPKQTLITLTPALRFETDCDKCFYYNAHIKNTGETPINHIVIEGFTLEKPDIRTSPNVRKQIEDKEFLGKWGFTLIIENLARDESAEVAIRTKEPYKVNLKCVYGYEGNTCLSMSLNTLIVKKSEHTILMDKKVVNFSNTSDFGIYEFDKNTLKFKKILEDVVFLY